MWNPQNYHADRLKKLNLNIIHVAILDWFLYFYKSGSMRLLGKIDGHEFYWVTYKKICADLLLPFSSNYKMSECFKELCGSGKEYENCYPLIKKNFDLKEGKKTGIAFRRNVTDWLKGTEGASMPGFFDDDELPNKKSKATSKIRKYKVNKNILFIFENIKKIELNGKILFNHKSPSDEFHYTSTYFNFQTAMLILYEGHFLTTYKFDDQPEWFKKKYSYYLNREKIIEKIRDCKNNWTKINELLVNSVKNYCMWFDPDSEVQDKLKLTKNINGFICHPTEKLSMFYCCLLYKPTGYRESVAEKFCDLCSGTATNIFNPVFKKEGYDGFSFWKRIYDIEKWFKKNVDELCRKDSNCQYWLQTRSGFFENYLEWIFEKTGKHPKIGNFGIGKTFDWYIDEKIKEHGIEITIPRSLK